MPKVFAWAKKLPGRSAAKGSEQDTAVENSDLEQTSSTAVEGSEKKRISTNEEDSGVQSNKEDVAIKDKKPALNRRPKFLRRLSPEKQQHSETKTSKEDDSVSNKEPIVEKTNKEPSVEKTNCPESGTNPEKRLSADKKTTSSFTRKFASFRSLGSDRKNSDKKSRLKSKSPEPQQTLAKDDSEISAKEESRTRKELISNEKDAIEVTCRAIEDIEVHVCEKSDQQSDSTSGSLTIDSSVDSHLDLDNPSCPEKADLRPSSNLSSSPRLLRGPGRQSISEKLYGEVIKEFDKIRSTKPEIINDISNSDSCEVTNQRILSECDRIEQKNESEHSSKQCISNNITNSRFTVSVVREIVNEDPAAADGRDSSAFDQKENNLVDKSPQKSPSELENRTSKSQNVSRSSDPVALQESGQYAVQFAPLAIEEPSLDPDEDGLNSDCSSTTENANGVSNDLKSHSQASEQSPSSAPVLQESGSVSPGVIPVPESSELTDKKVTETEVQEHCQTASTKVNGEVAHNIDKNSSTVVERSSDSEQLTASVTDTYPQGDSQDIPELKDNLLHSLEVSLPTSKYDAAKEAADSYDSLKTIIPTESANTPVSPDRVLTPSVCTDVIPLELVECQYDTSALSSDQPCVEDTKEISTPKCVSQSEDLFQSYEGVDLKEECRLSHISQNEESNEPCDGVELKEESREICRSQNYEIGEWPLSVLEETNQNGNAKDFCNSSSRDSIEDEKIGTETSREQDEGMKCTTNDSDNSRSQPVIQHSIKSSCLIPQGNDTVMEDSSARADVDLENAKNDIDVSLKNEMLALLDETFDVKRISDPDVLNSMNTITDEALETKESKGITSSENGNESISLKASSETGKIPNGSDLADRKSPTPVARRRLYHESDVEITKDTEQQVNGKLDFQDAAPVNGVQTNGDVSDDRLDRSVTKLDSGSLLNESYEESSVDGRGENPSPTAPRRKKRHPVPATRSVYTNSSKEDLLVPTSNGNRGEQRSSSFSTPPPRPPAPFSSHTLPLVRERSSTVPNKTLYASHGADTPNEEESSKSKSNDFDKKDKPVPAVRTKVSLNPFESDEDEDPKSTSNGQSQKPNNQSLNPFDSDYEDDTECNSLNLSSETREQQMNVISKTKEQPPPAYNPFDEDDDEDDAEHSTISNLSTNASSQVPSPKINPNNSTLSASSESSRLNIEVTSTNPFDEEDDDDDEVSFDDASLNRDLHFRKSLAAKSSSPFQREGIRASLPASTGKIYLSKKKRQAPLPPGFKQPGTASAGNTPLRHRYETALSRGESYTSLDRTYFRKNSSTSQSTLSLTNPKRPPPPRPPPPKVKSVSLAQLK